MSSFRKFPLHRFLVSLLCLFLLTGFCFAQKDKGKQKLTSPVAPEPTPRTPFSEVRRETLLNGLQIVTLEQQDTSRVVCELVIRGGSMFDVTNKTGLAKLTVETLLAVNPNLTQELETLQAKIEWGVTSDTTWFRLEAPANSLQDAMSMIARLLVVDNIRPDAFKNAAQTRLEKIKTLQLTPATKADEAFFTSLYGDHPYGHDSEGTPASIAAIKQGDVYDFYKRVYLANNMFAIVYGNLKQERVMSLFRGYFGSWIKGVPAPPSFRPPYRTTEVRVVKVEAPELSNVEIRGGVIGVGHTDPDFMAALLLSRVLEKRLQQLYSESAASFKPRILAAPLFFTASVPEDRALSFSRNATDVFATLNKAEISETELATAQIEILKEHAAHSVPEHLREIATFKLPETYPLTFETKIKGISTLDLQRVAKRLLEANALTVLVLGKVNDNYKAPSE